MLRPSSAARILRRLSRENAFYFFTSIGNYTGDHADSLEDFLKKITEISPRSLEFHLGRGDFEKWVDEVLEDRKLVEQVKSLRNLKLVGEALRNQLCVIISKRHKKLMSQLPS